MQDYATSLRRNAPGNSSRNLSISRRTFGSKCRGFGWNAQIGSSCGRSGSTSESARRFADAASHGNREAGRRQRFTTFVTLNSFQGPWPAISFGAAFLFHTKTQSHEDVAPTAKRLSPATLWPVAPLMEEWACRPKPTSSCLCDFVRKTTGAALIGERRAMDAETRSG